MGALAGSRPFCTGGMSDSAASGYHYWHDTVAKGESAAPQPEPQLLNTEAVAEDSRGPPKTIESFGLLDDDDKVKLYVALEGDLFGVSDADITANFSRVPVSDTCSMDVTVRGARQNHRLAAEKLYGPVVVEECKAKVNKKKDKIIITLKKANATQPWEQLRANVVLPYRRGGGG